MPASARPTSGRARQSLFDLLGPRVAGARVLDLYAGSGAVGLEAVSRGAARAVLVEPDAAILRASLETWRVEPAEVRVFAAEVGPALERLASAGERFDVVFADPPYARTAEADLAGLSGIVAPNGLVVVQSDAKSQPPRIRGLAPTARRAYGRNVFHFMEVFDAPVRKC